MRLVALILALALAVTCRASTLTVPSGSQVTISVAVLPANVTLPLAYQWSKNGVTLTGAIAATLVLPTVSTNDTATYTVKVTNSAGSITSDGAVLTVTPPTGTTTIPPTGVPPASAVTSISKTG